MASAGLGSAFRHLRGLFGGGSVVALEDGQLLARYESERDEAAFEALIGRHGPMVLTICRAVLRNEHDVEDAFQATFLVLARKAGSVRGGDALGGWLHRVAYRASVQAGAEANRRRRKEAEASAMAQAIASRPDHDPELEVILHEEIDRLPEPQRLPVVLCDLEGLTYEQAAHRLRWTVPTLRNRLARGRQRLKVRLTRRGVTAPAIVALMASSASAAVPPSLARMALSAATGGSASAGAATLAHTLLRGMLMTQLKIASTAILAALALAATGVIAAHGLDDPKPAMKPGAQPRAQAAPSGREKTSEVIHPSDTFELGGVVMAPDGKRVAGARVFLIEPPREAGPTLEAKSGPDGRFLIRVPRSLRDKFPDRLTPRFPKLIASAPGFSPGWVEGVFRPDAAPTGWGITLMEAGPAIEGRVVDLEGRPVAGARVESQSLLYPEGVDLSTWLASARAGGIQGIWRELQSIWLGPSAVSTTADAEGRFRMDGPGRGRVAGLMLSGPSIATEMFYVLGSDLPELRTTDKSWPEPRPFIIHAPRFQHASAPSPAIEGVVRDKDSGRPIAGVRIMGNLLREGDHTTAHGIESRTDAEGRYRLTGLPKWSGYRLFTFVPDGSPYLNGSFVVEASSPALDAIHYDLSMKRGIIVRGRVTDKATGKPVDANIEVVAFVDNPHVRDFPGYSDGYPTVAKARAEDDGRFEVVAIPGRGILTARADDTLYRGGVGAETIRGPVPGPGSPSDFETLPGSISARHYHSLAALDLDPALESATLDIQVDPGRSLAITAVGPDGQPIGGNEVQGIGDIYNTQIDTPSATFEVHALDPSRPRRVTITNVGRKLIGSIFLKGDESGPRTVQLQPWGVVTGRIVGDEDRPRPGIGLFNLGGLPDRHSEDKAILPTRSRNSQVKTDADGRFRIERLIPGPKYGASCSDGIMGLGDVFKDVVVAPGEVKDLGDLKVQPFKPREN